MIETIIILALFVNGLWEVTQPGQLLGFVRGWLNRVFICSKKVPESSMLDGANYKTEYAHISKLYYPILYCVKCMPSFWGVLLWVAGQTFLFYFDFPAWHLIVIIPAASAASLLIYNLSHWE